MFEKLFWSRKARLYLMSIVVVPTEEGMDDVLLKELQEIFGAPHSGEVTDTRPTDLGLEIYVPDYRLGDAMIVRADLLDASVVAPIMFRPRIELRARLYHLESGKTVKLLKVRRSMAFREGLSRLFSLRSMMTRSFTPRDVQALFFDACKELIDELKRYQ